MADKKALTAEEARTLHATQMEKMNEVLAKLAEMQPLLEKLAASKITGGRKKAAAATVGGVVAFATAKALAVHKYQENKDAYLGRLYDIDKGTQKREHAMGMLQETLDADESYKKLKTPEEKLKKEATMFYDKFVMGSERMKKITADDFKEHKEKMKGSGTSPDSRTAAPNDDDEAPAPKKGASAAAAAAAPRSSKTQAAVAADSDSDNE